MQQHGDDTYRYKDIRWNFSSNVFGGFDHSGLFRHLSERMGVVNTYPEPDAAALEREIATDIALPSECVMATNGATEAIYLIAQTFNEGVNGIVQPTFSEYKAAVMAFHKEDDGRGNRAVALPYAVDMGMNGDVEARLASVDMHISTLWICNPNNPTGTVMPKERVVSLIRKHSDTLFVLDHSYACFTEKPLLTAEEAASMPNVLMLHSMTKQYAIPGLRLGYVTGNAALIERLRMKRMPWSVNALAIEAGMYLLRHKDDYAIDLHKLLCERERVARRLQEIGDIEVLPSDTHILLCRLKCERTAAEMKEYLATQHGILIRDASTFDGLDAQYFRIAVQTEAENDELINAIGRFLGK